ILASACSAIVVYAQELVPGNVGMIAGLFFGFAFGIAGLGAAVLGQLADMTSVTTVYNVCAWLPALGLLTAFLPDIAPKSKPLGAQSFNSSAIAPQPSTRSQTALIAAVMGTASSRPQIPQSQPQNSRLTKIATGFISPTRLMSSGVSRYASSVVI